MDLKECSNLGFDADLAEALKKALADKRPLWTNGIRKKEIGTTVQLDMFIDDDYLDTEWYR